MAHKKAAGGGISQHKNPIGKRLGVKLSDGQQAKVGSIIVRQRGTKIHAHQNVMVGKDHTLFATKEGKVKFERVAGNKHRSKVSVI